MHLTLYMVQDLPGAVANPHSTPHDPPYKMLNPDHPSFVYIESEVINICIGVNVTKL